MEKLHYSILINASPEKVWNVLWTDETYRKWTSAFAEGSRAESDWKEGSKILFVDGTGSGMVSRIAESRPNEYMSFEHMGMVQNGVEDTTSDAVKPWAGSHENYTLKKMNGATELTIDMDINEEHKDMFAAMWPKALNNIKELAE